MFLVLFLLFVIGPVVGGFYIQQYFHRKAFIKRHNLPKDWYKD